MNTRQELRRVRFDRFVQQVAAARNAEVEAARRFPTAVASIQRRFGGRVFVYKIHDSVNIQVKYGPMLTPEEQEWILDEIAPCA